jgi:hypothetical protein
VKRLVFNKTIEIWNQRWFQTKLYFPTIDHRFKVKNDFEADFYVTQMISSHGALGEYLNIRNLRSENQMSAWFARDWSTTPNTDSMNARDTTKTSRTDN